MNRKSKFVFYSYALLALLLLLETVYINYTKSMNLDMLKSKESFVAQIGLPDLAISTEANYVRHRSMSDIFSIYKDDGSLREYFTSTFVYSNAHNIKERR